MWTKLSFSKKLLIIMTLSGLAELLVLVVAGVAYIKYTQEQEIGNKALGVAQFLAQSQEVKKLLETPPTAEEQQRFVRLSKWIGAAFIVIGDKQGIRIVHPLTERVGRPMKGGDNQRALLNGESYVSYAHGSLGYSVRGKTAIFDDAGEIVGVVSVGYLIDNLQQRIEPYFVFLIVMSILVVTVNGVLSHYASRRFQKAILGFEPEEISRLYVELDVTMGTVKEGIISIDANGVLRSINNSACQILGLDKKQVMNQPLSVALPQSDLSDILQSQRTDNDVELWLNNKHLIANRSPIIVKHKVVGAVSSFRLKDDINELTEQLSHTKAYAELLRSQTHEHRNRLNTISGLIQMGDLESVQQLIGQETAHYQTLIEFLRQTINDPLIAGLLLGKSERARELGLLLLVDDGSRLLAVPDGVDSSDLVTVLGNLIDNAFEATLMVIGQDREFSEHRKTIEVSISDFGHELILEVVDDGIGFPKGSDPEQFKQKGVTTKLTKGHGLGLYLVNQIVTQYKGEIEINHHNRYGARLTVYIPKEDRL